MASGGKKAHAQHWTPGEDAPVWLVDAVKDIGIQECIIIDGKKTSNPIVERFAEKVTGKRQNAILMPWCAFWLGAKLEYNNITSTKNGTARSYEHFGYEVAIEDAREGDIVVAWRGRSDDGVTGHVYFFLEMLENGNILGIGGNQGDSVSLEEQPIRKVLTIRRPKPVSASKTIRATMAAGATEVTNQFVTTVIPEPKAIDGALEAIKSVEGPIKAISTFKPWIVPALSSLTLMLILAAAWYRMQDHKSGSNN